jgi:hypothetical protein
MLPSVYLNSAPVALHHIAVLSSDTRNFDMKRPITIYSYSSRILLILSFVCTIISLVGGNFASADSVAWLQTSKSTVGIYGACAANHCVSFDSGTDPGRPVGASRSLLMTVRTSDSGLLMTLFMISMCCAGISFYYINEWNSVKPLLLSYLAAILQFSGSCFATSCYVRIMNELNRGIYEGNIRDLNVKFRSGNYIAALSWILLVIVSFMQLRSVRLQKMGKSISHDSGSTDSLVRVSRQSIATTTTLRPSVSV